MRHDKVFAVLVFVLAAAVMPAAQAQLQFPPSGSGSFYLGGEGGWTMLASGFVKGVVPTIGLRVDGIRYHDGFNAGARGGYQWGPWRIEEEFRYQDNAPSFLGTGAARGDYTAAAVLTNLLYEFGTGWVVRPHIGAGIGPVLLDSKLNAPGLGRVITGSDWVLGYQAIGGISYDLSPTIGLEVDYRYLGTQRPHFKTGANFVDSGVAAPGLRVTSAYDSHSVVASLIVRLGAAPLAAPAPPLPPVPPPPAARKLFMVFFDWDSATINSDGMQILRQAAASFRAGAPVTIQVTGFADRSGAPGYNQRLSERRANNVADVLTRLGVPRSQIAVSGRGENDNRVPTADGVREPQNRRVEIVFP